MAETNKTKEILKELRRCEGMKVVFNSWNKFTQKEIEQACVRLEQLQASHDDLLAACEIFVDEVFDDEDLWKLLSRKGEKYEIWLNGIIEAAKASIAKAQPLVTLSKNDGQ